MRWIVNKPILIEEKNQFPQINPIILQLLFNRGLKSQKEIDEFLYPDYSQDVHDPFLFSEMKKAVKRIFSAIENQELIMVHGDYDADGICGSLLLIETLEKLGAKTDIYIPDRVKEGYGLKEKAVDCMEQRNKETKKQKNTRTQEQETNKFQNLNSKSQINSNDQNSNNQNEIKEKEKENAEIKNQNGLIITVDCGIKSVEAVEYAQKKNIDVIITDHHYVISKDMPNAFAIIHPKTEENYPFKDLAGAGVAFKLAQALLKEKQKTNNEFNFEGFEKWLLDLLAIATVADLVPLLGENKTLTKYGLIVLNKTKRIGLKKLIEVAELLPENLNVFSIGFQIAPRINATGRLGNANTSYQLLKTQDEEEATKIAEELNQINQERQRLVDEIVLQAINQVGKITNKQKILFVLDKNWPEGILGLVAGKLCKNFNRPIMAMTFKEQKINNKKKMIIKGSGRSNNFNLILSLEKIKNILISFGGHIGACGFSFLENDFEDFKKKLNKIANKKILDQDLIPILNIDQEINLFEINWELFEELKKFEPYGKENSKPKFLIKNLKIVNLEKVGQNGQHLKLLVADDQQKTIKMIGFNFGKNEKEFNINDKIDVVFEIDINEWNGNRELQLKIVDLLGYSL
ncbi:MAG: single-stranded-DNA-specific exonuclease RecJ [Candidatus Kuenenbacteria bacterium]